MQDRHWKDDKGFYTSKPTSDPKHTAAGRDRLVSYGVDNQNHSTFVYNGIDGMGPTVTHKGNPGPTQTRK